MPLLALLGRWCRKLLPCTIMPVMVHIAYWTTPEKRHVTILGATPGGDQLLFSPTRTDDPYFDPSAEYRFRPPPGWVEERQARQKAAAKGKEPKKSKVDTPEPNGKDSAKKYWGFRGWVVVSDRQARLVDNGLEPPPGNALVNPDSGEQVARSNYGVCVSHSAPNFPSAWAGKNPPYWRSADNSSGRVLLLYLHQHPESQSAS